ncbi:MAG: phosphoribosylamine--glycine ligase [Bacteroidia bacterium]
MNILLLGSGGREHAFAKALSNSPGCDQLYISPGNAGTAQCGINVGLDLNDFEAVGQFCLENHIELVVPGNEDPLVAGISDALEDFAAERGIHLGVAGPDKWASQLEGSKQFAKEFMMKYGVPTAAYQNFNADNLAESDAFLESLTPPYVLKADGLAAGKGVIITHDLLEAKATLKDMILGARFGAASANVVVEEFLQGIEISVFVVSDGIDWHILGSAKDYKRIGEGDTGPNTGGMGAISPVPFADESFMHKVKERIVIPSLEGLRAEGHPYRGFLFLGLMNDHGDPKVIEYNVRMGDPETEAIFPRLKTDMVELLNGVAHGNISQVPFSIDPRTAATVFLVSQGYPGSIQKGFEMSLPVGIEADQYLYHAGTALDGDRVLTNGGRVLAVTSLADTLPEALQASYKLVDAIRFEGKAYRRDIGQDLLI